MGKKKRKPSAYNIFVGKQMKKGLSMKEASVAWKRKQKSPSKKKTTSKKTTKSRKKPTTTRRRPRPRGQKKPMFPMLNRMFFRGPLRQRARSVLGV